MFRVAQNFYGEWIPLNLSDLDPFYRKPKNMKTLKILFILFVSINFLTCVESPAEKAEDVNENRFSGNRLEEDAEFLVEFTEKAMRLAAMSELATDKSLAPEIRRLGIKLKIETRTLLNESRQLGRKHNIVLPNEMAAIDKQHLVICKSMPVDDFDRLFIIEVTDFYDEFEGDLKEIRSESNFIEIREFVKRIQESKSEFLDRAEKLRISMNV